MTKKTKQSKKPSNPAPNWRVDAQVRLTGGPHDGRVAHVDIRAEEITVGSPASTYKRVDQQTFRFTKNVVSARLGES